MRILIACEESQRVCEAFRSRGHEAFSADIQDPSGGHPEWHILGDVRRIKKPARSRRLFSNCYFCTFFNGIIWTI